MTPVLHNATLAPKEENKFACQDKYNNGRLWPNFHSDEQFLPVESLFMYLKLTEHVTRCTSAQI